MTENFNSWNCSRCGGAPILFDERGVCQKCHDASEFAKTVEAEMGKAIPAMIKSFNKAGIHGGGFPDYCPPEHDEAIELQRMLDLRIAARNLAVMMQSIHEAETVGDYAALLMEYGGRLHAAVNVSEGTVEKTPAKTPKQMLCAHDWDEEITTCVRCGYQPPLDANGEPI